MNHSHEDPELAAVAETPSLLKAYEEICKSYHSIDEFRTRLLGLLPLSSLIGIFLLDPEKMTTATGMPAKELFGFASLFAALLTLALLGYEIRGMRRTHTLIFEGYHLERQLGIKHGQFHICTEKKCHDPKDARFRLKVLDSKFVACFIYSTVFIAWVFIGLRLVSELETMLCAISATITGIVVGSIVFSRVKELYAA
jgi:hypothetical protein